MAGVLRSIIGLVVVASFPAWPDIVFVGPQVVTGNGFGNNPRALTIQSHGPSSNSESGCIAPDGSGGLLSGSGACAPSDGLTGGDEANPIGFPKQAAPSLSSLGITSGAQLGILFDAVQPQNSNNDVVTINDLTLKLYNGTTLIFTASGTFSNLDTNPGNGQSDYLFALDSTQATAFDKALGTNFNDTIALDSMISFPRQSAGPDSFTLINTASSSGGGIQGGPVPEPRWTAMSLALLAAPLYFGLRRLKSIGA